MAVEIASATGNVGLLKAVRTFVTSVMAPAGERWAEERWTGYEKVLVSTELGGSEGFRAFDGNTGTEWSTAIGQSVPSYLGLQLVSALDVRHFAIRAPNSTSSNPDKAPATFTLDYSDDGAVWTPLETFNATGWGSSERRQFVVTAGSAGAHLYWRIHVTVNDGEPTYTAIAELEILEDISGAFYNHADNAELILRGPGLAAADSIYVGMQVRESPTIDVFNWRIAGFTGYVAQNAFAAQPGGIGTPIGFPLWSAAIPYWLVASGRRIALVAKVETTYQVLYLGLSLPYATPGQMPYPLVAAGMLEDDSLARYSDLGITMPWAGSSARGRMRHVDGTWREPGWWPYLQAKTQRDVPGGYAVMPVIMTDADNLYGELDGVAQVSGFNNAVENTVTIASVPWLVVQDTYRTGLRDYFALRLS